MKIETQRKNIVHRILEVQNAQLLNKIEKLLDNETYTFYGIRKTAFKKGIHESPIGNYDCFGCRRKGI